MKQRCFLFCVRETNRSVISVIIYNGIMITECKGHSCDLLTIAFVIYCRQKIARKLFFQCGCQTIKIKRSYFTDNCGIPPAFSGRIAEQRVANRSGGGPQGRSELKLIVGRNFQQLTRVLNHIAINKRFRIDTSTRCTMAVCSR